MEDFAKLTTRIDHVERQLQQWKRVALALSAFAAISFVGWAPLVNGGGPSQVGSEESGDLKLNDVLPQRPDMPQEMDIRRLRIMDEHGKPRIDLSVTAIGPTIQLLDDKGGARTMLFVNGDGPGLSMTDTQAKTRVGLSVLNDESELRLLDPLGETWAVLMEREKRRMFVLAGADKSSRMGVLLNDDAATLTVASGRGPQRVTTRAGKNGVEFSMIDSQGDTVLKQP